jgi:hypothetical protein
LKTTPTWHTEDSPWKANQIIEIIVTTTSSRNPLQKQDAALERLLTNFPKKNLSSADNLAVTISLYRQSNQPNKERVRESDSFERIMK